MLSIMLASLTVLYIYACAVCASDVDTDGAIVEPTQPTEPRCDRPHCSSLEKLNLPTKSDLVRKRKTELRILNSAYDNCRSSDNSR